jgi:hypothetical protein
VPVDRKGDRRGRGAAGRAHAKYVGWDTKTNTLFKILDLDSDHCLMPLMTSRSARSTARTLIDADEAVGDASNAARRHRHCDRHEPPPAARRSHVIANPDVRWDARAGQPGAA